MAAVQALPQNIAAHSTASGGHTLQRLSILPLPTLSASSTNTSRAMKSSTSTRILSPVTKRKTRYVCAPVLAWRSYTHCLSIAQVFIPQTPSHAYSKQILSTRTARCSKSFLRGLRISSRTKALKVMAGLTYLRTTHQQACKDLSPSSHIQEYP